ncbi:MAG TPA: hypothetical protein DCQ31_14630 [Bacteroidales bacterium]|nr:hypothetical protein [Bacteroidales bacterium]
MNAIRYILIICALSFLGFQGNAQNSKLKKAEAYFAAGAYYKASVEFEKVYVKVKDKKEKAAVGFKIAECCRLMNDAKSAQRWYERVIKANYNDPNTVLYLAEMLKMQAEYELASEQYKAYLQLVPDDKKAVNALASCDSTKKWLKSPTRHIIEPAKWLNSRENDFGPVYYKSDDVLLFTSTREASKGKKLNQVTGKFYADIFTTTRDRKGKWSEPVPVDGGINTEFDEGTPTFGSEFDVMYYTACRTNKAGQGGCAIYKAAQNTEGFGIGEIVPLFADSSVSVGHPALSKNGLKLIIVSDAEGTLGSKDLWLSTRKSKNDKWEKPTNMGNVINTPGNEMFPVWRNDTTLYFSSDFHPGMGGLDIFEAFQSKKGDWRIANMQSPINSSFDDFGIIFSTTSEEGYLCSNRDKFDNIFRFQIPPILFSVKGTVFNTDNRRPIEDATVQMYGSDGSFLEIKSEKNGSYKFKLKENTDYRFVTEKVNFLKGKGTETTKGYKNSKDFVVDIPMTPIEKPIELPNILYDFNKAELRPESMIALDKLVETLNDNPNITIELAAHTDYVGSDEDNLDLSQRRAQSVVDYLIEKGISSDRLTARGYGETKPKVIDEKMLEQYTFLKLGETLTETYIATLPDDASKDTANQINRRTEFSVISTNYKKR